MVHIGTILDVGGYAFAVYAAEPIEPTAAFAEFEATECGRLLIPARFKLVVVCDEPAPDRLPPDLSESAHGP